jgi:hypothetical protein
MKYDKCVVAKKADYDTHLSLIDVDEKVAHANGNYLSKRSVLDVQTYQPKNAKSTRSVGATLAKREGGQHTEDY